MPANSPLSPITPTLFEPLIMAVAQYEGPWAVTLTSSAVYMYMEYLNWHLYRWVLTRDRLAGFRAKPWVRKTVGYFGQWPFFTVVFFALTPLPFWVARILAILHSYSLGRFMAATAIGRVPRFFAYAWFGSAFKIPLAILVGVMVGGSLVVVIIRLRRGQSILEDSVLDARADSPPPSTESTLTTGGLL